MNIFRAALVLLFTSTAWATPVVFIGNATDLKTGELLYREIHTLELDEFKTPIRESVEYVSASGVVLGEKQIDYQNLSAPDYSASFLNFEFPETVDNNDQGVFVSRGGEKLLSKPDDQFAIDGGFHYFIQENFSTLLAGTSIDFDFLSAGRKSFIPLRITPEPLSGNTLKLSLSLQNFFLARIVKPIELEYNAETRKLLRYSGLTNVPNESGKLFTAQIDYIYSEEVALILSNPISSSP